MGEIADFVCSGCEARYRVVRVKAEADDPDRVIHCRVCKRALSPRDGEYILKYFLVGRARAAKVARLG
jgi:NAD-dependent SIR2 family protein deacetylase